MNKLDNIKTDESQNKNWFRQSALQLGALAGATYFIYKYKDPANKLASKFFADYKAKIIQRHAWRNLDSQNRLLGPDAAINRPNFGIDFEDAEFKKLFPDPNKLIFETDSIKLTEIEASENSLIQSIENAIDNEEIINKNEMLFKLKIDTLYHYINTRSLLRSQDRTELNAIKDLKDLDRLDALHNYYLQHSRDYSNRYGRSLADAKAKYRSAVNKRLSLDKATRAPMTKEAAQDFMYGARTFDTTPETAAILRYQASRLSRDRTNINVFDLLKTDQKVTSGSLSEAVDVPTHGNFSLLSKFEYNSYLKKIATKLEELQSDLRPNSMVKDIQFNISSEHAMGDRKRWFLNVTLIHKVRGAANIRIPLSQHGILAGSSAGTTERLDGFYGKDNLVLHPEKTNLRVNMELENMSQRLMRLFYGFLDSDLIEGSFAVDPKHFESRVTNSLNKILLTAPAMEGTDRDYFKIVRLVLPSLGTKKSKYQRQRLQNVVDTGTTMKHFSNALREKADFVRITLDFETLSRDLIGPQWMAKDTFTEITKAGFVISDFEKGKVVSTDIQELVSDHAIASFDRWSTKRDTISWLRREVPNSNNMDDSEVVAAWKKKISQEASESFKRSGVSFKSNSDIIAHTTKLLIAKIKQAVRDRKQIFFVTKNGTEFDLELLKSHAGTQWGELKKYVKFIDVQANAKLHQMQGADESMTLTKMIMRLMRNKHATSDEIVSVAHGNMQSAVDFFRRKGMIQIKKELLDDYINQGVIGRAHTSATDALMTDVLLMHDHEDLYGHPDIYKNLSEIEKLLKKGASLTPMDESFEEARLREKRYKIEGQVVSSAMLGQGQQAKEIMSLISPHHIIPFSDSSMSSQRDQFFGGIKVQASDFWLKKSSNIADKQLYNKYFKSVFVSKGEVNAMRVLKGDAMTNYFQHHVIADTIYTFNSWAGQEGYSAFSEEALKRYNIHIMKRVDLSSIDINSDANLNVRLIDMQKRITAKARELANSFHGKINSRIYNEAAQIVVREMESQGLNVINKGEFNLQLSHGNAGITTVKKEMGGKITNVLVNLENNQIRMHAEIAYAANGADLSDIVFRTRDLGSKAIGSVDRYNSLLLANQADKVANADFFSKGDVGVHKQLLVEKAMHKLFDTYNYGSAADKERAKKALQRLAADVKSDVDFENRTFVHNYDNPSVFKNIVDPDDISQARKFYGNIDMNFEKLRSHLVDAGVVWNEQQYKNWLGMFGGEEQVRSWIKMGIEKHNHFVEEQRKNSQSLYSKYSEIDIENSKKDYAVHLQKTFLPDWNDVRKGTAAKDWEPFQMSKNDPSTFIPGFRVTTRSAIYQVMNGGEFKMTKLKSKGNLLHMIDLPFSHVSKSTLASLKNSRRAYAGDRFTAAMATLTRFKDALMSKANLQGMDLSVSDINKLLDNTGGTDVKKLARWVFNDGEKASIINKLTSYMDEVGEKTEGREAIINEILTRMQHNKYVASFDRNKNIMTASATEVWETIGKERGVLSYSRKPELGGAFTFHIEELLQNSAGFSRDELPKVKNELLDAFEHVYKADPKEGIVKNFDRKKGIVELRKIIMHADTTKENIANILNPLAGEKSISMASSSTKYQRDVLEAIKAHELYSGTPDMAKKSEEMLKKQYLIYLSKGFLLDKTSVYFRAFGELAPYVAQAHTAGAGIISEKAAEILSTGGMASKGFKGQNVKAYDDLLMRLSSGKTNMADIYMTSSRVKQMTFDNGTDVVEHLTKIFGYKKANLIANGMSDESLPGYMTRHPQMQSGTDAVLDNKLHIIPDELAPYLGMNSNEVNVHAIYTGLFKMDFDGDQGYFGLKAFKDDEALRGLHAEHSAALSKALESFTTKKIIPLREAGQKLLYRSFSNGMINVSSFDDQGNLATKSIDIKDQKATDMMVDMFSTTAKNAHLLELNDHSRVTMGSAQKHIDQLAATQVAKGNIGIFTDTAYRRARMLMQVGMASKDPLAARMLIGNLVTGDAAISQMFVSLAKHDDNVDIKQYASAAKAYIDPTTKDVQAQSDLETMYKKRLPKGSEETFKQWKQAMSLYQELIPRDELSRSTIKSLERLDLGRDGTSMLDVLNQAQVDFVRDYNEQYKPDFRSPIAELGDVLDLKLNKFGGGAGIFKKGGVGRTGAAVLAGAYLVANFFKPNQLSNSLDPFDAFTDLGTDIDGSHNRIYSDLELDRSLPLDTVNASFSKQAYIRLNKDHNKRDRSKVVQGILDNGYQNNNPLLHEWKTPDNLTYTNNVSYIGYFGNSNMSRKSNYVD